MAMGRAYDVGRATDPGRKRSENEDRLDAFEPQDQGQQAQKGALYVVADGMGGHEAGAVASDRVVRKTIDEYYYGAPNLQVREGLERAIQVANAEAYRLGQENPDWAGMGATVVAAVLRGEELQVANVGDSRAILFRPGAEPRQLSVDHTFVSEQVRLGKISAEEAARSPRRHQITRSLGRRPDVAVELAPLEKFRPGDVLVLCSDGLTDMVTSGEIRELVLGYPAQQAADKLVALANDHGGADNISVIVVKAPGGAIQPPAGRAATSKEGKTRGIPWVPLAVGVIAVTGIALVLKLALGGRKPPTILPTPTRVGTTPSVSEVLLPTLTPKGMAVEPTSTLVPTDTPVPATPTPRPTNTATRPAYSAPELQEPNHGAKVKGDTIPLRWSWKGELRNDEYFDLWVWPVGEPEKANQLLKASVVSIYPPGGVGVYRWKVRIVRGDPGKPGAVILSDWSQVRQFDYQGKSGAAPTGASATPMPRPSQGQ